METAKIVGIYALFGLAWIYGSDTVLGWLVHDPDQLVKIAVVKGSLFILCTATLLYVLINRFIRQLTAAEALQIESLRNYEAIFNATDEAIFVHDAQSGRILDINDRMLEMFGYSRDEALNIDIGRLSEGTPPYSQAEAVEYLRKALFDGPQVFEWRTRKKSGELFWSEVSLRRITINDLDRIIAVVRDVRERKQLDDELRARDERHRIILDSAMDGFWVVSQHGRLLEVNDAYCRMSGYSKQEILSMSIADFDVNETAADTAAHINKVMELGEDRFETQHRRRDGSVFDVEVSARHLPACGGLMVGFLRDITERKRAEEALRESNERLSTVFDSMEALVYIADMETYEILFVNSYGRKIWGSTLGQKCWHAFQKDQNGPCAFCSNEKLLDKDGQPTGVYVWEFQNTLNGRWFDCRDIAIPWTDGRMVRLEIATDITDRKRAEEERINHEKQMLQAQKLESLGVLAGGIAHDFNNILTAIMGNISYARMDHDASQHAYEPLLRAEKAAKRAAGLAKQLLAFSKGGSRSRNSSRSGRRWKMLSPLY